MDSAATFTQYYQNSPNFTSIEREKNNDLIRTIPKQLIPTKTTNINNILKKDPNFKSFNSEFRFTSPSDIYKSIISETRSSLPFNEVLMNKIDVMYKRVIETNLNAVYKWSPNFFIKTFYTQTFNSIGNKQITINQENFIKYEKYIYLLCLIYYINHNKEKIRGELNKDADAIINWAQIRNNDAIGYILNGPDSTYEIPGDFISHYNLLLSTANAIDDLAIQNQLAKTDLLYSEITNFHNSVENRSNSFDKLINEANQYFLILKDEEGMKTEIDDKNNLVFNASFIDIGEINDKNVNGNYFSIIVQQGKSINPPSRISFKSLLQLFNQFNSISITNLEFDYNLFKNDISKFNDIYLVFPGIQTTEHTIIGNFPRGSLIIGGKFINNSDRRRYEFIPNEPAVTFDGSQTKIDNFNFYITNNYNGLNSIIPNNLILKFNKEDIYNHLLTTNIQTNLNNNFSINVESNKISYKFPENINELNITTFEKFKNYLKQLEFVPNYIFSWIVNQEFSSINDEIFSYFMKYLKRISNFHKWQVMNFDLPNRSISLFNLIKNIQLLSENSTFQSLVSNLTSQIFDYQSFRENLINLNNLNIELFMNKSEELLTNQDLINYVDKLFKITSILSPNLTINPTQISLNINTYTGLIDGKNFHFENSELMFVYDIEDADIYKFVNQDQNNTSLIRFFDDNLNIKNNSTFLYVKDLSNLNNLNILQRLPFEVNPLKIIPPIDIFNSGTVIKINRKIDDENNIILSGGDEIIDISEINNYYNNYNNYNYYNIYANITDYSETYQLVDYWFNNSNIKLKFIKYISNNLIDSDYFKSLSIDINLFESEYIINGKTYSFIINLDKDLIIYDVTDNLKIDNYSINNIPFNILNTDNKLIISSDEFEYTFYIDNSKVSSFEINKFIYEDILIPWTKTTFSPNYKTVSNNPAIEISTANIKWINDKLEIESILKLFQNNNLFKAYYCFNDPQYNYWKPSAYESSIVINPIVDIPINKSIVENPISFNSNELNCIYTINEDQSKTFYPVALIFPNLIITSDNFVNKDIYIYEILNEILQSDSIQYSESSTIKVLIINKDSTNSMIVELFINYDKQFISKIIITNNNNGKSLTIYGNLRSEINYSFDSSKLDDEYLSIGNYSMSYKFNENSKIKVSEINLSLVGARLRKYSIENNNVYESILPNYYFNINSGVNELESNGLLSLSNTNYLDYKAILLTCKYYQNNIDSEIFTSNNNFKMVIDNLSSTINNKFITIRKDEYNKDSNPDVYNKNINIAENINFSNKYLCENLNEKFVVNDIDNKSSNNKIAINPEHGVINLMGNNLMNLTINFK